MSIGSFLAVVVVAGAMAFPGTKDAAAQVNPGAILERRTPLGCASVTADATMFFGPNVPSVGQTSPNGSYGHGQVCQAYVVDFHVGAEAAQVPSGYVREIAFDAVDPQHPGYFMNVPQAQCGTYVERISVYTKNATGTFVLVGGGYRRGVWAVGDPFTGCSAVPEAGFKPLPSFEPLGLNGLWRVYRVATSISLNGTHRRVRAQGSHLLEPPH